MAAKCPFPICPGSEMSQPETLCPTNVEELRDVVAQAASDHRILEVRAGGSKREIGDTGRPTTIVDLSELSGVVDYAPSELVLTVKPATPLAAVESILAENGQMLAFEPWDHGPIFGRAGGAATIGGVVVAGVSGPRRVSAGAARDHLLGFQGVSGRGEIFRGGGKVVKNVTGYDVSKLVTGSWGQLVVLSEISLKVVPRPRYTLTLRVPGLKPQAAIAAMAAAMGSKAAVAATAHVLGGPGTAPVTLFRLEGFRESVDARACHLRDIIEEFGNVSATGDTNAAELWVAIAQGRFDRPDQALWRIHLPPSHAADFSTRVERVDGLCMLDWAGAAGWVSVSTEHDLRAELGACGGHAMLIRTPEEMGSAMPIRQPENPSISVLSARIKHAFDPAGILDPHRFG